MDLSFLPDVSESKYYDGHMMPTDDVLSLWKDIKQKTNFKHIFEIGTNAGHSASIVLELFSDVKVTSLDICKHDYTLPAVDILKERYKERFNFIESCSTQYFEDIKKGITTFPEHVDIFNIDGHHFYEYATNDLELCLHTNTKYAIVDDTDQFQVNRALRRVLKNGNFELVNEYSYNTRQFKVSISLARNTKV